MKLNILISLLAISLSACVTRPPTPPVGYRTPAPYSFNSASLKPASENTVTTGETGISEEQPKTTASPVPSYSAPGSSGSKTEYVRSYVKKDGTVVKGYVRSKKK